MLAGFLDWQRNTLLFKCSGLTGDQLARWACPPSNLSLLGLVRHVTDVERTWFRSRFAGEAVDSLYWCADSPDAALEEADPAHAEPDIARLITEWDLARRATAGMALGSTFLSDRWGEMSVRWAFCHLIEEYARHSGHADMIRQRIDAQTGA